MNNLFLIWDLDIIPADKNNGVIKSKLNFQEMKHLALKNQDVYNFFAGKKNCPEFTPEQQEYINFYYLDVEIDGYRVQTRFIEITNTMLLTDNITCDKIIGAMGRHFINFHDVTTMKGENMFKNRMDKMIDIMETKSFYDISEIHVPIKTKLFNYQINNINWMIKREIERPQYHMSSQARLIMFPDGRIYNYNERKFVKIEDIPLVTVKGGVIADEVGKGKTVQMLSLCFARNIPTLILVPPHLKKHWENELSKHFMNTPNINLVTFKDFKKEMLDRKKRIIVDELHILYSDSEYRHLYDTLCSTKIEYKWGLTATPFAGDFSIHKITQYLTDTIFYLEFFERFMYYESIFVSYFKRNVEKNINDELVLPPLHYHNHFLNFTNIEQNAYMTEISGKDTANEMILRKICCDIMISVEKIESMTEKEFIQTFLKIKEVKLVEETNRLEGLKIDLQKIKDQNRPLELHDNIRHYENLIKEQDVIVKKLEAPINFLKSQLAEDKTCAIGMCEEDTINTNYAMFTKCNHYFCTPCLKAALKKNKACPYCRSTDIEFVTISNDTNKKIPYSTKINKLLEIIQTTSRQFIVFTQFEMIIEKLITILGREGINAAPFSIPNVELFRNNNLRVLILSSKDEACGLDISFVSDIIIFEPVVGNYVKDIEKQIVGRIYRINQTSECNVHRLIVNNTIEEKIYKDLI